MEIKTNLTDKQKSIIGKIFNRLKVIGYVGKLKPTNHDTHYLCECSCGKTCYATKYQLEHDMVKSCGCLHTDTLVTRNFKHGLTKDPRYKIAHAILSRVNGKDPKSRKWYFDKGITCDFGNNHEDVCLGLLKVPGYFEGASIDRIDPDSNYTLFHPEHGFKEWIFHDDVLGIDSKCVGNLRWISVSDNVRRFAAKPVTLYETKPVTKYYFKKYCESHNLDYDSFDMIDSGLVTPGNKLKQYYFKAKVKLDEKKS